MNTRVSPKYVVKAETFCRMSMYDGHCRVDDPVSLPHLALKSQTKTGQHPMRVLRNADHCRLYFPKSIESIT